MQGDTSTGSRVARRAVAGLSVAALVLTTGCWVGLTAVNGVENQLTVDDSISSQLASATPDAATTSAGATQAAEPQTYTAENILVVGSDTRTGQGPGYGSTADSSGNGHSDTAFILHISADRKSAFAVNIPRDSWVQRPSCNADGNWPCGESSRDIRLRRSPISSGDMPISRPRRATNASCVTAICPSVRS